MADVLVEKQSLQDIADAIRDKQKSETKFKPRDMDDGILSIQTDITGDATAKADDIINPATAYVKGEKLTGTIIPTYETSGINFDTVLNNTTNLGIYDVSYTNKLALVGTRLATTFKIAKINEQNEITTTDIKTIALSDINNSYAFKLSDVKFSYKSVENNIITIYGVSEVHSYNLDDSNGKMVMMLFVLEVDIETLDIVNQYSYTKSYNKTTSGSIETSFNSEDFRLKLYILDDNRFIVATNKHTYPSNETYFKLPNGMFKYDNNQLTQIVEYDMTGYDKYILINKTYYFRTFHIEGERYDRTIIYTFNIDGTLHQIYNDMTFEDTPGSILSEYYLVFSGLYDKNNNQVSTVDWDDYVSVRLPVEYMNGYVIQPHISEYCINVYSSSNFPTIDELEKCWLNCTSKYMYDGIQVNEKFYIGKDYIISSKYNDNYIYIARLLIGQHIKSLSRKNTLYTDITDSDVLASEIPQGRSAYSGSTTSNNGKIMGAAITIPPGYTDYLPYTKEELSYPRYPDNTHLLVVPSKYLSNCFYYRMSSSELWINARDIAETINLNSNVIKSGEVVLDVTGTFNGVDTSDATATANDILSPKTAYVQGNKLTGQIMPAYRQQDGIKLVLNGVVPYPVLYWNTKIGIKVYKETNTEIIISRIDEESSITELHYFSSYKLTAGAHGSDTIECCDISDIPNDDGTYNFVYGIGNYVYSTTLNTDTITIGNSFDRQDLTASATSITHNPVYRDIFSYVVINQGSSYTDANIYIYNMGTGTAYRLDDYLSYPGSVTMTVRSQWDDLGTHLLVINNFNEGVITYFPDTTTFNTNKKLHSGSTSTVVGFLTPGKVAFNGKIYALDDVNYTITELNTTWLPPVNEGEMLYYLNNYVLVHYYSSSWYISYYPFNDSGNYLGGETQIVKYNKGVDGLYRSGKDIVGWLNSSKFVYVFSSKVGPLYSLTREQQTFVDTSDANANTFDIMYPKTAYVNGNKLEGKMKPSSGYTVEAINYVDGHTEPSLDTFTYSESTTHDHKNYLNIKHTMKPTPNIDSYKYVLDKEVGYNITYSIMYEDLANRFGIIPSVIKSGTTILDVTGTYEGIITESEYNQALSQIDNLFGEEV